MRNSRGFTLPELVVALALTTLIGLGMSSILSFNYGAGKSATQNYEFNSIVAMAQVATLNPTLCPGVIQFGGVSALIDPTKTNTIDKLVMIDQKEGNVSPILDTTGTSNTFNMFLQNFTLTPFIQINPSTYIMNFNINANKYFGAAVPIIGNSQLTATFPLYVHLDTSVGAAPYPVLACSSAGGIPFSGPLVQAWVTFGSTGNIIASNQNITGVAQDLGTSLYTISMKSLTSANYSITVSNTPGTGGSYSAMAPVDPTGGHCGGTPLCPGATSQTSFTVAVVDQNGHLGNFPGVTVTAMVVQ